MQKTERELTDEEMIEALQEIIDMLCETYLHPVRDEVHFKSRDAQIGFDTRMILFHRGMIKPGTDHNGDGQMIIKEGQGAE